MQAVKDDNQPVKRSRRSVRTPEGMLRNFLIRVIGPGKLMELYNRLKPEDKARFIVSILPFVQSRKAAEPFSEEEIDRLHALINKQANENASKVV